MGKSNKKPQLNKFQLKIYLIYLRYLKMGNSNFHNWKYLNFFQKIKKKITPERFELDLVY